MARRKWALLNHNDAAVAATRLIVGACVQEVAFGPVSWSLFLTRSQDGSTREFGISSDSEISAHEDHFVDMERDLAAAMVLLHGLIGSVVREVQALGAMHYRIVLDEKTLIVRELSNVVDNAMTVYERPPGEEIFCG
jgi:hypothetical protein